MSTAVSANVNKPSGSPKFVEEINGRNEVDAFIQ